MGGRSKQVRNALKKTGLPQPMAIPCKKGHTHNWPTQGPITKEDIGRCQVVCQFCSTKGQYVEAKWPWHLRRHVWDMHREDYPHLIVPPEWSGKKQYSKGKVGPTPTNTPTKRKAMTTHRATGSAAATPPSYTPSLEHVVASGAVTPIGQLDSGQLDSLPPASFDLQELIDASMPVNYNHQASTQLASSESGSSASDFDIDAFLADATASVGEFALQPYDQPAAAPFTDDSSLLSEMLPEIEQSCPFAPAGFDQPLYLPRYLEVDFDFAVSGTY